MDDYAKQTQFLKTENERNPLWKKGLRKKTIRPILQKQTQTKPICSELACPEHNRGVEPISQLPIAYCIPYGIPNGRHSQLSPEVEDCGSRLGFSERDLSVDIVFV